MLPDTGLTLTGAVKEKQESLPGRKDIIYMALIVQKFGGSSVADAGE